MGARRDKWTKTFNWSVNEEGEGRWRASHKRRSQSPNKTTDDCDGTGKADKNKGKVVPKQPTTLADRTKAEAATIMLDLKRKSAAEDDVDRMKSIKIDDKEGTLSARRR
jgi:hypothetical protein